MNKDIELSIIIISKIIDESINNCLKSCKFEKIKCEYIIVSPFIEEAQLNFIKNNKDTVKFISDKSQGVYSAINDGLKNCKGKYILLLHADNFLTDIGPKVITKYINLNLGSFQLGCYFQSKNGTFKKFLFSKIKTLNLIMGLYPPHPGLILKKTDFQNIGYYKNVYPICADFDYYIKIKKNNVRIIYDKASVIVSLEGGISTQGIKSVKKIIGERVSILENHFGSNRIFYIILILIGYLYKFVYRLCQRPKFIL